MIKHIDKLENGDIFPLISNLNIQTFGHFNLFSGTRENGYNTIKHFFPITYPPYCETANVRFIADYKAFTHYSDLKQEIMETFGLILKNGQQIFATTQRYDVIQAFAEVAQEYKDVEAYYYRLGRSGRISQKGRSMATMYDVDAILDATNQNIEVR